MHIGYILKMYPRLSETFVLNELLALEGRGVETTVLSLRDPTDPQQHPAVSERRGDTRYIPRFGEHTALQTMRDLTAFDPTTVRRVFEFIDDLAIEYRTSLLVQGVHVAEEAQQRSIDHLHCHFLTIASHVAHIAHLLSGISYSVTAHAKDIYRRAVDWDIARRVADAASTVVTVCDANVRHLQQRLPAATIARVYNGIPIGVAPVRPQRTNSLVLGVGRLVEKKGFDTFIETIRILANHRPNLRAVIIGDGELRPVLERRIADHGLEDVVGLLGPQLAPTVQEWMLQADILLAPCRVASDGNQDALPTVLIEALRAGLPAVSTPVAGIEEIITSGREGFIVPSDEPGQTAEAVDRVLADAALWDELSANARLKAATMFDRQRTIENLIDVFTSAVAMESVA